jgi:hypothetical protein
LQLPACRPDLEAVELLGQAVDYGLNLSVDAVIDHDTDLKSLHGDSRSLPSSSTPKKEPPRKTIISG